jgi:hypothetical protein
MFQLNPRMLRLVPALMLAAVAGACDPDSPVAVETQAPGTEQEGPATLKILLTDAAADYTAEANVDIGRVELLPAGDGAATILSEDGTDGFVNLLELQNAATMQIAEAEIEPGAYHQLRLIVESANVRLIDGYTFDDGSQEMELRVPSGAQTGIKLLLQNEGGGDLELGSGESVIVLDFDVNRSFVIQGNPRTPAGIKGMLFKPTLKVTGLDVAASISGVLSVAEGLAPELVAGRTVIAEPTGSGDLTEFGYQSAAGTGVTDVDGSYTIFFLVPGEYEVSVLDLEAGLGTDPRSQTVTVGQSEDLAGVDFQIVDVTGSIAGSVLLADGVENVEVNELQVTATPMAEGGEPLSVATDAEGAYLIDDLLPGIYTVEVAFDEEGFLVVPGVLEVEVGRAEEVTDANFTVIEVGSVRGTVSTALEGFTLAGRDVTAAAPGQESVTVTTDDQGRYTFTGLAAASWTITVAVGDDFVTEPGSITAILDGSNGFVGQDFAVVAAPAS